jgi:hypothetical protein
MSFFDLYPRRVYGSPECECLTRKFTYLSVAQAKSDVLTTAVAPVNDVLGSSYMSLCFPGSRAQANAEMTVQKNYSFG